MYSTILKMLKCRSYVNDFCEVEPFMKQFSINLYGSWLLDHPEANKEKSLIGPVSLSCPVSLAICPFLYLSLTSSISPSFSHLSVALPHYMPLSVFAPVLSCPWHLYLPCLISTSATLTNVHISYGVNMYFSSSAKSSFLICSVDL